MADKTNGQQASKANGITKMEAVRRALAELGMDAKPAALQPFIKQKFGFDMTPEHITTCKGAILKATGKGKPAAPAKAAASPPATAPQQDNGEGSPMTKLEAVKRAMARMGRNAKPLAIKDYLKSQFNIEISADVASNYKKQLKKAKKGAKAAAAKSAALTRQTAKAPLAPKPQASVMPIATPAPRAESPKPTAGGVSLQDLLAVKDLVSRVGAENLRTLVELLAR
jgi:hypothetical protein